MQKLSLDRKVGLALSSGSARGLAHIGVLEIMEKEEIPVDLIAGTSMGSIIGAMYACGMNSDEIKKATTSLTWKELAGLFVVTLPNTGFLSGRKIRSRLNEILGGVHFSDLRIPFACVATDIITGEEAVMYQGPVVDAVLASMLWPVVFRPVMWQGRYLVDGGIVDPVPVNVLKNMGADFVICSNVIVGPEKRARKNPIKAGEQNKIDTIKAPSIFNTMMQFINIAHYQAVERSSNGADIIIKPSLDSIGFSEFYRSSECIYQGKLAAQAAIPEIKRLLADYYYNKSLVYSDLRLKGVVKL
ncbi:MAG: patatin-like phospholipase family protein [Dehalococcoidales bacterium]